VGDGEGAVRLENRALMPAHRGRQSRLTAVGRDVWRRGFCPPRSGNLALEGS
jgi:hypothetical protein